MTEERKPSDSFRAVREILLDRERVTPASGTRTPQEQAWFDLLSVEADAKASEAERKLARALRILLGRTHGP